MLMRLLIVAVQDWVGIARMPRALRDAGFEVAVLAPRGSYLTKTRYAARWYPMPLLPLRWDGAVIHAIHEWQPVAVIPGDDLATQLLHRLRDRAPPRAPEVARVLDISLGGARALHKGHVQQIAQQLGLPIPPQAPVHRPEDALRFSHAWGFPCVLKQPYGFGGLGVHVCDSVAALEGKLRRFFPSRPRRLLNYLASAWVRLLPAGVEPAPWPQLPLVARDLQIQRFIPGAPALYCMSALRGLVLAGFAARKERVHPTPSGPSTLVYILDHPEMAQAAAAMASQLQCSGFASFDFILEAGSGRPYLLECNPRPVPVTHLGRLVGADLCAALYQQLASGRPPQQGPVKSLEVALFPQEWRRDPSSPALGAAYHDVPWDDPALLRALVNGEDR